MEVKAGTYRSIAVLRRGNVFHGVGHDMHDGWHLAGIVGQSRERSIEGACAHLDGVLRRVLRRVHGRDAQRGRRVPARRLLDAAPAVRLPVVQSERQVICEPRGAYSHLIGEDTHVASRAFAYTENSGWWVSGRVLGDRCGHVRLLSNRWNAR